MSDFNPYSPPSAPLDTDANTIENPNGQKLNPWISMWTRPRATIQQIIDENPERLVLLLAAIGGFSEALDRASMENLGDKMGLPMIFAIAAVGGPIMGVVGLYIGSALLRWTGEWIGGKGTSVTIRAAMAWSNVLIVWSMLLWIPSLAFFGHEFFSSEIGSIEDNPLMLFILMGIGTVEIVIRIWAFVAYLKCLGQVQGFSAWKALGNTILAGLVVVLPIMALIFVFYGLSNA